MVTVVLVALVSGAASPGRAARLAEADAPRALWLATRQAQTLRRITLDEFDPYEPLQWHLANDGSLSALWPVIAAGADIDADLAWLVTEGDPGVVIAVLDTGFPPDHADLPAAARAPGFDFVDGDDDPAAIGSASLDAHGLAVAALAAAPRNGSGVVGVCPRCTILPVRVLHSNDLARDGDLVAALLWAATRADVISCSWSYDPYAYVPASVHAALAAAVTAGRGGKGAVVVFSAGNRAEAIAPFLPQARRDVLVVGASDETDLRAGYSNTGPSLALLAPGGIPDSFAAEVRQPRAKLVTADLVGDAGNSPARDALLAPGIIDDPSVTASFFGTSAAAPIVAGAVGLLLSAHPELSAREVRWLLTETADEIGGAAYADAGHDDAYGYGRLNIGAALARAASGDFCHDAGGEDCQNGSDDDCDRAVDADDEDCGAPSARAFTVPLGLPCDDATDCGDGLCSAADGGRGVRVCTALCDYDCPDDGACTGAPGRGRCARRCDGSAACPAGTVCARVSAEALPPNAMVTLDLCLPACDADNQCADGACRDGGCTYLSRRTGKPAEGFELSRLDCDCATLTPSAWLVGMALWLWITGTRRRPLSRPPA